MPESVGCPDALFLCLKEVRGLRRPVSDTKDLLPSIGKSCSHQ